MNRKGFTLVEIIITVAIIGMIASIAIPMAINMVADAREGVCKENLRTIDNAKVAWALDNNQADDAEPDEDDLVDYVKGDFPQSVVAGALYKIGSVMAPALCSYHGNSVVGGSGITFSSAALAQVSRSVLEDLIVADSDWVWAQGNMVVQWPEVKRTFESPEYFDMDRLVVTDDETPAEVTVNGTTLTGNVVRQYSAEYIDAYRSDFETKQESGEAGYSFLLAMNNGGYCVSNSTRVGGSFRNDNHTFYDSQGSLIGSVVYDYSGGPTQTYSYDSEGNLLN